MVELCFNIRSSSGDGVYHLKAYRTVSGVRFSCSCNAGEMGMLCKHRLSLIEGDDRQLLSSNPQDIQALKTLINNSPIFTALSELKKLEEESNALKKKLSKAKKNVGITMRG